MGESSRIRWVSDPASDGCLIPHPMGGRLPHPMGGRLPHPMVGTRPASDGGYPSRIRCWCTPTSIRCWCTPTSITGVSDPQDPPGLPWVSLASHKLPGPSVPPPHPIFMLDSQAHLGSRSDSDRRNLTGLRRKGRQKGPHPGWVRKVEPRAPLAGMVRSQQRSRPGDVQERCTQGDVPGGGLGPLCGLHGYPGGYSPVPHPMGESSRIRWVSPPASDGCLIPHPMGV